jgi:hypothetical protein
VGKHEHHENEPAVSVLRSHELLTAFLRVESTGGVFPFLSFRVKGLVSKIPSSHYSFSNSMPSQLKRSCKMDGSRWQKFILLFPGPGLSAPV